MSSQIIFDNDFFVNSSVDDDSSINDDSSVNDENINKFIDIAESIIKKLAMMTNSKLGENIK